MCLEISHRIGVRIHGSACFGIEIVSLHVDDRTDDAMHVSIWIVRVKVESDPVADCVRPLMAVEYPPLVWVG